MDLKIPETITERLDLLCSQHGFTVVASEYFPEQFGNVSILLENEDSQVTVFSDRGDWMLSYAARENPNQYTGTVLLRELLDGIQDDPQFFGQGGIAAELDYLISNLDRIEKKLTGSGSDCGWNQIREIRQASWARHHPT